MEKVLTMSEFFLNSGARCRDISERSEEFTTKDLARMNRFLKDFGITKVDIPDTVKTKGELERFKLKTIKEKLSDL